MSYFVNGNGRPPSRPRHAWPVLALIGAVDLLMVALVAFAAYKVIDWLL